jgi:type II secretory pathway predicted ATPase ExeA
MYLNFYGLREQPFGVTPDPRYLYLSAAHREAFASLYYGIEANRGFLGLIAKPGMGKTTILFHLLEKFRSTARTAFLFQTQCNSREFMRYLLAELGYEGESQDFVRLHEEFNRRLLQEARAGNRLIVVIDEAQNLDASVLETVRLLSDFETPRAKLMHIILAGQPELADKLASPGLAQLRQRISILHGLEPLPSWEIKAYIEHRMKIAGYEGEPVFTADAYEAIADFTEGIPRNVNNFCFNALSLGYATQQKLIDLNTVKEVISDLDISKLTTAGTRARETEQPEPVYVPDLPMHPVSRPAAPEVLVREAPFRETPSEEMPVRKPPIRETAPRETTPREIALTDAPARETIVKDSARKEAVREMSAEPAASEVPVIETPAKGNNRGEILSPAEAAAYMQEVALKLKNWQRSLEQSVGDVRRNNPRFQVDEDKP